MFKSKLIWGFYSLSLLLILTLMFEWFHFRFEALEIKQRLDKPIEKKLSEKELEGLGSPDISDYTAIIERPLFVEGRKPSDVPFVAQDASIEKTPLNLKLMGIVFTPTENKALLVDVKGKYWHVSNKGMVLGWKLISIEKDRVKLQHGIEVTELKLDKPKLPLPTHNQPPPNIPPPAPIDPDDEPIVENNAAEDEE